MTDTALTPTPTPGILDLPPYRGFQKPKRSGRIIRLMANEGALGPSPKAVAAFKAEAGEIYRYPQQGSGELLAALAQHHRLEPEKMIVGNGSDELIELLTNCFLGPGDEAIHTQFGFVMFKQSTRAAGATPVSAPDVNFTVSVDAILDRLTPKTKIVFLANPNNPTGSYIPHQEVERLHRKLPGNVILVLDAAYAEYVNRNDYSPGAGLVEQSRNVIMLRTFSKLFALAGLRIGWGYGAPAIIDALNRVHGPFNVNIAAQAAGIAALADTGFQEQARRHNEAWMPKVQEGLKRLGLLPLPSVANFVLVKVPEAAGKTAPQVIEHLAKEGIFVREMATYGLPDHFRFSLGTAEENEILLAELKRLLGTRHG